MQLLKLIALESQDLDVLSTHLQDAVVRVADLNFDARSKRFACVMNRFNWEAAAAQRGLFKRFERRRSGLRFERVLAVRTRNLNQRDKDRVLSLLAIGFRAGDAPGGYVTLTFSGGATIELEVECIEAEMRDLGAAWETHAKPVHRADE